MSSSPDDNTRCGQMSPEGSLTFPLMSPMQSSSVVATRSGHACNQHDALKVKQLHKNTTHSVARTRCTTQAANIIDTLYLIN